MYTLMVKDHIMIAHSLPDPLFGLAQKMHGATYNIEASFKGEQLNPQNVVMDIGVATDLLRNILAPLRFQNLDELPQFKGILTTTEYLAKYIHDRLKTETQNHIQVKVVLHESQMASASYEG